MKPLRPNLKNCPICGSKRIRRVQTDYVLRVGDKLVRVRALRRHECPNCGEKFFDYEATKRIEAARAAQAQVGRKLSRTA
jgi:YgiT-type zinc finger domain-containing protein